MSIRYIQFRHDIVVPVGGPIRSFGAWQADKHADFCEPEQTQYGLTLHEIKTDTTYLKGVAVKEHKRTGKRWLLPQSSIGYIQIEDDKTKAKAP